MIKMSSEVCESGSVSLRGNLLLAVFWIVALVLIGCRSRVINVNLTNSSSQPVSSIIVDYPTATFGVNTLDPGKSFHYVIKPLDTGTLKIQFADAAGRTHNVAGPLVKKGQEGTIEIKFTQDSALAEAKLQ
jgi:hypothetical protein